MPKLVLCQEPRSPGQLRALKVRFPSICSYKCRSVSCKQWIREPCFRQGHLVAKHQRDGCRCAQQPELRFPSKATVQTLSSTPSSQGCAFLLEYRRSLHLSAEIPTAVFKCLKSGLSFYWR